jgi:hypothetical protein
MATETTTAILKVGQIIYWKTMFGEYFKGEITGLSADTVTVTRLIPYVAYGVTIKRSDVC